MIYGNVSGGFGMPKTIELTDENGYTVVGAVTGSKVVLTAKPSDVKIGKIAATDEGITEGTDTKTYRTTAGVVAIPPNAEFKVVLKEYNMYDYTKFQAMIMPWNTSYEDSVAVDKCIIADKVYNAGSTTVIASISKNNTNKTVEFGISNGATPAVIRYMLYKEES